MTLSCHVIETGKVVLTSYHSRVVDGLNHASCSLTFPQCPTSLRAGLWAPKRIGSPIPLCTVCSTRLISARAQQTLIELNYLVLLRRKWQRSDRQEEEREMLTEKEKNGTSVRRQDGGNQHFSEGSTSITACPWIRRPRLLHGSLAVSMLRHLENSLV